MKRDNYGIIIQTEPGQKDYEDGGDSAFSTGIMAFSGSIQDSSLLKLFVVRSPLEGDLKVLGICRHPFQKSNTGTHPHNDPRSVSRDQVLAFFSGLHTMRKEFSPRHTGDLFYLYQACLKYAGSWFVNKDFLLPHNRYYLYRCCGIRAPIVLTLVSPIFEILNILFDSYITPKEEKNQSILRAIVMGKFYIYLFSRLHGDLLGNVDKYFKDRDKQEIADLFNRRILQEWSR